MKLKLKAAATAILAVSLIASYAYASDTTPPAKKHTATQKARAPKGPTIQEQVQALRQQLEEQAGQISGLRNDLADKDAQLKNALRSAADAQAKADQAQAKAAEAQATADNAQAAASAQQQAVSQTASAVERLNEAAIAAKKTAQVAPGPPPSEAAVVKQPAATTVNAALTPLRTLPVGGVDRNEANPPFKADGVGITPYGFIKLTGVEDSSDPGGDDFPLPGFITSTGPTGSPEFHLKARSTRFGMNFDWYDPSAKWVMTGRIEGDFEGNFNRSDNRNISTMRSSNPSVRLAWARLDYHANSSNTLSGIFGQDWTIYSASTLPNILETTGVGIGFGGLWERDPQMRFAYTHKFTGFAITPEIALDLPSAGLTPSAANISNELGYGERQGPDSNRPEIQGRIVGQWQLDHAKGVAPAQIIFSGFNGKRTANVLAATIAEDAPTYASTFATGAIASSKQDGWDGEWQLPTRWFTLTGKVYSGADLRWFFGGQLYSFFNDTAGLSNTVEVASIDGASNIILGTTASGQQVVAPERPIRASGGFAQLGLPLSRIFNANPSGRNSGWSILGLYGVDQAKARDVDHLGEASRKDSTMAVGTLNYKMNKWTTFVFEESLYTTHANSEETLPLFRGVPSREWNDIREEFGPVINF
jgi:hypothetical protein